jgi:hypothetical protein
MALPLDLVRHVCSFLPACTRAFLTYGGAYRLLRWPSLSGLQYVELGEVALPSLAGVQFPPRLQALVLHDNHCTQLAALRPHRGLKLLCLGSLPLYLHHVPTCTNGGVPPLAGFPLLQCLHLSAMGLADGAGRQLTAVLASRTCPLLHTLHLDRNALRQSPAGLVRAACARCTLQYLELGYNPLGHGNVEQLIAVLAAAPPQRQLRYLGLGTLGWEEDAALTELFCRLLPRLAPHLCELVAECNNLALPSVQRIAQLYLDGQLPRLRHLDLADNLATKVETAGLATQLASLASFCLCCGF